MVKQEKRGRSGSAAAGPGGPQKAGGASAAAASGATGGVAANGSDADARAAYQQYVKGKRQALDKLLKIHSKSPSAATCLLGAKLHVLEAAEAAFKDGDAHAREAAVLQQLHRALELAVCGADSHGSPVCLVLTSCILHATGGRPGGDERRRILDRMVAALGARHDSAEALASRNWRRASQDAEGLDGWPFEPHPGAKHEGYVAKACAAFAEEHRRYNIMEAMRPLLSRGGRVSGIEHLDAMEVPADRRMTDNIGMLPPLTHLKLKERQEERAKRERCGGAAATTQQLKQEQRQQHHRRQREQEERAQLAKQAELEGRRIPELRARAAKIQAFLASRAAAAAGAAAKEAQRDGADSTAVEPGSTDAASGTALPRVHLAELLQQTEVGVRELLALLADRKGLIGAAEQQAVLQGLQLARAGHATCCQRPPQLAALLDGAPSSARRDLAAGSADAAEQAGCLVARLRELLHGGQHELTPAKEATIRAVAPQLVSISAFALAVPRHDPFEQQQALPLPSLDSVLPECPGDLEALLGQELGGAAAGGPPHAVGSALRPPRRAGRRTAAALAELDFIDGDELELEQQLLSLASSSTAGPDATQPPQEQQWQGQDPRVGLDRAMKDASRAAHILDCLVRADGGGFAEQLQGADTEQGPERPPVFSPRSFLSGLQLLDLLEQRAQLASAAGGPGQPDPTVLEGVAAGLGRLAALAAQGQPVQVSGLVKIFVPDPEDHVEELIALESVSDLPPVEAGASVLQQRAWRGVHDVVQAARAAGLDAAGAARPFLAEVRKDACRSVVSALRMLRQDRRMAGTTLAQVCRFVRDALPGGEDDGDCAALANLGQLPLVRLLQLRAFLALHASQVYLPSGLDAAPELQDSLTLLPAEVTPTSGVRLTPAGLATLEAEAHALQAAAQDPEAEVRPLPLPAERMHLAGTAAAGGVEEAAGVLSRCSMGLPLLEAAAARRKPSAALAEDLQEAQGVQRVVLSLQRLAHIHRVLAGLASLADMAEQATRALRSLLDDAEAKLAVARDRAGRPGCDDACRESASAVAALAKKLPFAMDRLFSAASNFVTAQNLLLMSPERFRAQLLQQQEQGIRVHLELAGTAGQDLTTQQELLRKVSAQRQTVEGRVKLMDRRAEGLVQGLQGVERDNLSAIRTALARGSRSLENDAGLGRDQYSDLQSALRELKRLVTRHMGLVLVDCGPLVRRVADAAAEQAEACIGELVYAHSLRPSLEPAFRALTRHLLAPKWEAELAAQQAAEEEARREAALQALLQEEEEEDGGSAAAQAKQEQKRAKKKAKKAAKKKEAPAAVDQAEPQQQAAPQGAEQGQDSRQQEREAGLQRLLQQMQEDQEEQARQQQQQQQEQQEHQEQERERGKQQQQQQKEKEEDGKRGQVQKQQQQRRQQQQERVANEQQQTLKQQQEPAVAAPEQAPPSQQAGLQAPLSSAGSDTQREAVPSGTHLPKQLPPARQQQQKEQQFSAAAKPPDDLKQAGPASKSTGIDAAAAAGATVGPQLPQKVVAGSAAVVPAGQKQEVSAPAAAWGQDELRPKEQQAEQQGTAAAPSPAQQAKDGDGWQEAVSSRRRGGQAGRSSIGAGTPAPASGAPLQGRLPQPSGVQPGPRSGGAAQPAHPPSSHAARAAAAQRAPAGGMAWQRGPPAVAAAGEPGTSTLDPDQQSGSKKVWQQRKAASGQEPSAPPTPMPVAVAAGAAGGHAEPAGEDAELASLLGMMGVEEQAATAGAAAAAASSPSAASSEAPTVSAAASGSGPLPPRSSWARRAGGASGSEPTAALPTEAAAAATAAIWPAPGQSQEDAELEAAIQASLSEAAAAAAEGGWRPSSRGPAAPEAQAATSAPAQNGLGLAGLRNEAGEYNCFLNVIVQCLWRCADFRRQVAGWDPAFCGSDPVVSCLHDLFQQFQRQEEQLRGSSSGDGEAEPSPRGLSPVDPTPLREALAALPGQQFRVGEMNDAAEVLLAIYERVMEVAAGQGRPAGIEPTFGLSVCEEVHCPRCSKATHQTSYTQYFYNTQATVLHMLRDAYDGSLSTGRLLREAEAQHQKTCDKDVGGCGRPCPVNYLLQRAPRVFTLQLAWESHSEKPADIAATLAAIDEEIDLGEVYQGTERGSHRYRLRSMVCYYGQHYQALVLVPEAGGWLVFDDTRVALVGSWDAVRRKCEAGRIQPSVLFYEAV